MTERETLKAKLADRAWRLNNLYYIRDDDGNKIKFKLNAAQRKLLAEMHYLNIILKARQLGFTTFIQIYILDACLFNSNVSAGVIADTLQNAKRFLTDIVGFAYENLPEWLKADRALTTDSVMELVFSNGSSIRAGTSLRSGTYQFLHISEFGKICARSPEKAREIRTGALNTLHSGNIGWIESTAEGRGGDFYDLTEEAQKRVGSDRPLSDLEFKFHFFPWWEHPEYRADPKTVILTAEDKKYFAELVAKHGIVLRPEQHAWYVLKKKTQKEDMPKEFPSTPEEAFKASIEGAYFKTEMACARATKRICRVPFESSVLVDTFWDLGMDDYTSIWFHQRVGLENRFIRYLENNGEGLAFYAEELRAMKRDFGYSFGKHYLPHDVEVTSLSTAKTRKATLEGLGVKPIIVVPRIEQLTDGIQMVRNVLPSCWFDEVECATGIKHLENYRKQWDEKNVVFKSHPVHDKASHGADSIRQFAQGYRPTDNKPFTGIGSAAGGDTTIGY